MFSQSTKLNIGRLLKLTINQNNTQELWYKHNPVLVQTQKQLGIMTHCKNLPQTSRTLMQFSQLVFTVSYHKNKRGTLMQINPLG